ncbi:MAG: glycoside hydrolase family 15 protein [Acidobacteriota bacterium]|nr:glycoside hydrolase family 15 protein [Acidobacteriota bacterium]
MRDIPVGNGSLLVTFDDKYQIRDIYFPHVGQENHTEGYPFRFGIWTDGEFSWIFSADWERNLCYEPETLVTDVKLINKNLGIEIISNDTVASHENIFLRRVKVKNLKDTTREVRVFLHQDFRISETKVGDTAFYDPESLALVHYKKDRYFLINTEPHFDVFTTGRKAFREEEGTWRDAEDGELRGNAITEGSVDSTIGLHLTLEANQTKEFYYWIAAGKTHAEVKRLNRHILDRRPQQYLDYSENYWSVWANKNETDFADLSPAVVRLFKRSLLIIRTQIDNAGAILAANDWDVTERATDHYSYLWTRDGALVANALDLAGYPFFTRKFFNFCAEIVHADGYFLQKYNSDGTVASGWHAAWDVWAKKKLVPIQEDETALVLWALWQHYDKYREIEFVRELYRPLIVHTADFLLNFRDEHSGLPLPSWNLWEDRRGIHTFTCATVVGGLRAAANFAHLFGEHERGEKYVCAAGEIVEAMRKHLYSRELGRFLRALQFHGDEHFEPDETVDASLFALFYFGAFDVDDEIVKSTMRAIEEKLWIETKIGGVARFSTDGYMRVSEETTGNAWFVCTLWLAEYRIACAKNKEDLTGAVEILEWTAKYALPSGVLAEQIHPTTGEPVSVSPLTWSHSTFVATVMNYLKKKRMLDGRAKTPFENHLAGI